MDTSSLKNAAFGGYDKQSVYDLFEELSLSYSVKLTEIAEEKGLLLDKIAVLEKQVASLEESLSSLETEKEHVAKAIVSAEKEAAKILSSATLEAETLRDSATLEAKNLRESAQSEAKTLKETAAIEAKLIKESVKKELKDEFDTLKDLRLSMLQAMSSYKDKLDAIAKRLGADE